MIKKTHDKKNYISHNGYTLAIGPLFAKSERKLLNWRAEVLYWPSQVLYKREEFQLIPRNYNPTNTVHS